MASYRLFELNWSLRSLPQLMLLTFVCSRREFGILLKCFSWRGWASCLRYSPFDLKIVDCLLGLCFLSRSLRVLIDLIEQVFHSGQRSQSYLHLRRSRALSIFEFWRFLPAACFPKAPRELFFHWGVHSIIFNCDDPHSFSSELIRIQNRFVDIFIGRWRHWFGIHYFRIGNSRRVMVT